MLTPKQLYDLYSSQPCTEWGSYPELHGLKSHANGTPHYMRRVVQFMKHLKYPCISNAPGYNDIKQTGDNQLALTYKFLESLDSECFKEQQPSVKSGTSHSVRNACDISRACTYIYRKIESAWEHRMATEYLERFGINSLSDCLMALGPDLVPNDTAYNGRAPNMGEMSCLPLPSDHIGATGSQGFSCMTEPNTDSPPKCRSCGFCPDTPVDGDPCCEQGTIRYQNLCCGAPLSSRANFALLISVALDESSTYSNATVNNITTVSANSFEEFLSNGVNQIDLKFNDGILLNDRLWIYSSTRSKTDIMSYKEYTFKMKHVGILPRKIYGGYANFLDNSGSNFYAIFDDLFLDYFQSKNGFDYQTSTTTFDLSRESDRSLLVSNTRSHIVRARTISLLNADTSICVQEIKDLLWNGYGIVLFSNVGFPNSRDSRGLSYPDRIWYTTYSIIGYDDTKKHYDECVYILHCPWGKWNSGGQPYWGDLPDGAFVVTEQHLKCMLTYYPDHDYYDCRDRTPCNRAIRGKLCDDQNFLKTLEACGGHGPPEKCEQYFCAPQQRAMGLAFAVSLNDGFIPQDLQYWNPTNI